MINKILNKSIKIRKIFLNLIIEGNKYHLGGSLSCLDFICTAIYGKFIKNDKNKGLRDFILSKGHALGIFHSILLEKKIIKKKIFIEKKIGVK